MTLKVPTNASLYVSLLALIVSVISATFSGSTVYFNFLSAPTITTNIGSVVLLNQKPYVGVSMTLRNTGAKQAAVTNGTLKFDNWQLGLVMESIEPDSWTLGETPTEIPAKLSFFRPIVLGKDETANTTVWFEADTGGTKIFTNNRHALTLNLFNGVATEPVSTTQFSIELSADNVTSIYTNTFASLPVNVRYSP